jgi:lipoprotein NlpI
MGQIWEGAQVLVMRPGTDGFHTIQSRDYAALSRNELSEKISVPKLDGEGSITVRHTWSGAAAEYRRQMFAQAPQDVIRKALLEPYEERYPGVSYAEFPRLEDDTAGNVLTLAMALKVPKPAIVSGNVWAVRFRAPNLAGMLKMPPSQTRTQPFALPAPAHNKYQLEVEFPPEVSKVADPLQRVVRDENFELVANLGFRGNRATANMELKLLKDRVEPARTAAYMAAVRRTSELPSAVFVDKDDVKTASLFKGTPTLQQSIALRLQDRIEKLTRAIESGRLEGEDLGEAHCERAQALLDLGKAEDGLKDASLAVKLAPNSSRAHACRASAYFANGDFARSVADYTRAISLDPSGPGMYYDRGRARFYAGQLAAAADDFAKAGLERKGTDEHDSALYSELWRVWTQKRLGIEPSSAQQRLAAADPRGEWPRAALAMLHGQMSVKDMLATLDAKKGDERELALVEAYFYAGQWYLLQGDKATATDYFRKTREKGITMYVEHVGAGFELRALGAK